MHIPKLYREEDREIISEFLKKNNFPALVTSNGEKLIVAHLALRRLYTSTLLLI